MPNYLWAIAFIPKSRQHGGTAYIFKVVWTDRSQRSSRAQDSYAVFFVLPPTLSLSLLLLLNKCDFWFKGGVSLQTNFWYLPIFQLEYLCHWKLWNPNQLRKRCDLQHSWEECTPFQLVPDRRGYDQADFGWPIICFEVTLFHICHKMAHLYKMLWHFCFWLQGKRWQLGGPR